MVKDLERPEPGEYQEPRDILGEGRHIPAPEGEPPDEPHSQLRHWSRKMAPVRGNNSRRFAHINDPCRRTSDDLYPVSFSEASTPAEPRNDVSAEHSTTEVPSVPDDAPVNDR